jgi:alkanesulfonate monooxygenase SsuD/methylene tetrahydromethanopterin reductase-like flavin-dependent oxidoreductase (luciferase family)
VGRGCAAARFYYGDNDPLESGTAFGGNADSVCRQVERWAETRIDQMIFMFQIGRTTHDQIMRAIEIVGEKVIPRFAD